MATHPILRHELVILVCIVGIGFVCVGCGDDGPYFVRGSARLPDCLVAPAFDLDGTEWFDTGVVTIQSTGCGPAMPSDMFDACALSWVMTQEGEDVEIIVDTEYRIHGRLCGSELHLEGGWWLPVEDEGVCTYDEDSADEVGIEDGGSVLSVAFQSGSALLEATGTLSVSGSCDAQYAVTLTQFR